MSKGDFRDLPGLKYEALYAHYLDRDIDALLKAAGGVEGKRVLDLCGGTGKLAARAKELGAAYVGVLDTSMPMVYGGGSPFERGIDIVMDWCLGDKTDLGEANPEPWDIIVCRQAINYWFSKAALEGVLKGLVSGGVLVFNTFNTKPSERPEVKVIEGGVEVHYLVGDTVYHWIGREGMEAHTTTFQWIPPEEFNDVLLDLVRGPQDGPAPHVGPIRAYSTEDSGHSTTYVVTKR